LDEKFTHSAVPNAILVDKVDVGLGVRIIALEGVERDSTSVTNG